MANKCPICGSKLILVKKKEDGKMAYIKCSEQKTEKKDSKFLEVGKCKFKINFETKFYSLTKDEMVNLLSGSAIEIKDNNILKLNLNKEMFTEIEFTDKFEEEDF